MKILFIRLASYYDIHFHHPENVMMPIDISIMMRTALNLKCHFEFIDLEAFRFTFDDLKKMISRDDFDLIVVKAKSPSFETFIKLFKNTKKNIIGMGHIFSCYAEKLFSEDIPLLAAISGEPELSFGLLLQAIKNDGNYNFSNIPNITWKIDGKIIHNEEQLVDNLDELPNPYTDPFLSAGYFTYYPVPFGTKKRFGFLMHSRGCPYKCIFCSPTLRNSRGDRMRYHSAKRTVDEMEKMAQKGVTIVQFRDDSFTIDKSKVKELCLELKRRNLKIKWIVQTNINNVDKDLLMEMKSAGCCSIGFGIESGSPRILSMLNKNNDLPHAMEIFDFCKKIGIKTVGFFLLGSPGEEREDIEKTIKLLKNLRPDLIQLAYFTPYPGSQVFEKIKQDYKESIHHYNCFEYNFSKVSTVELKKYFRKFYLNWLLSPSTLLSLTSSMVNDLFFNPGAAKRFLMDGIRFTIRILFFNLR